MYQNKYRWVAVVALAAVFLLLIVAARADAADRDTAVVAYDTLADFSVQRGPDAASTLRARLASFMPASDVVIVVSGIGTSAAQAAKNRRAASVSVGRQGMGFLTRLGEIETSPRNGVDNGFRFVVLRRSPQQFASAASFSMQGASEPPSAVFTPPQREPNSSNLIEKVAKHVDFGFDGQYGYPTLRVTIDLYNNNVWSVPVSAVLGRSSIYMGDFRETNQFLVGVRWRPWDQDLSFGLDAGFRQVADVFGDPNDAATFEGYKEQWRQFQFIPQVRYDAVTVGYVLAFGNEDIRSGSDVIVTNVDDTEVTHSLQVHFNTRKSIERIGDFFEWVF